jgi:hypothetical protein
VVDRAPRANVLWDVGGSTKAFYEFTSESQNIHQVKYATHTSPKRLDSTYENSKDFITISSLPQLVLNSQIIYIHPTCKIHSAVPKALKRLIPFQDWPSLARHRANQGVSTWCSSLRRVCLDLKYQSSASPCAKYPMVRVVRDCHRTAIPKRKDSIKSLQQHLWYPVRPKSTIPLLWNHFLTSRLLLKETVYKKWFYLKLNKF